MKSLIKHKSLNLIPKIFAYTFLGLMFCVGSGCKKLIELDDPKYQLFTESVFKNDETAIPAMTGIYSAMLDRDLTMYRLSLFPGVSADEFTSYWTANAGTYTNALQPLDAQTNSTWQYIYNFIFQANGVYEGCDASTGMTAEVKKQLMAEAKFVRAFWHFYLVNLYGDVPLVLTTDYEKNLQASRTPKADVYKQIIDDLKYAAENLKAEYVAGNTITSTTERLRPNKAVATALLSRVYLYAEKYAEAEQAATLLISDKATYDMEPINNAFLKGSKEAIWQLMKPTPNASNINTYEGNRFILTAKPANSITRGVAISPQLLSAFDATDLRKVNWMGKFTDKTVTPNVDYYYPYKYKVVTSTTTIEHLIVLRLSEQYLIRAEAKARQNNLGGAIDDLDVTRARAGISLIKVTQPSIGKDDLLAEILKERQRELFAELGHRWLDLKRTGTIDAVMTAVAPSKKTVWDTRKQLWPIPQQSILTGPNLIQNPSYN